MSRSSQPQESRPSSAADFRTKIVEADRLVRIVTDLRHSNHDAPASRIVQCHGCFDIVHPGHIRYLQFAKSQGDILVVSITGDSDIGKGAQRPYIPQELRAENLAALAFVDYVVIDPHPTAVELLGRLRPDVYVKGREYAASEDPRFLAERSIVESSGGRVVFSSGDVVFSSSRILESLENDAGLQQDRLSLVCRRHRIQQGALTGILDAAVGQRILVVGDLFVERYVFCDDGGMSTESPMMSLRELDRRDYIGGAGYLAAQLAALGARPRMVTAVGNDEQSAWAVEELRRLGVEIRSVCSRDDLPVRCRYVVDGQKVFKVDRGLMAPPDSHNERATIEQVEAAAIDVDSLLVQDSGYGIASPGLLRFIDEEVRPRMGYAAGGCRESRWNSASLKNLNLIGISERRLRLATNDRDSSLSTLAYQLLDSTQAQSLIVTVGKRGLVTFSRPSTDRNSAAWRGRLLSEYFDAFSDRIVDRLGAGDALLAVSALCGAAGANLMQSAYVGGLAASIGVGRMGPVNVRREDLVRAMAGRPELTSATAAVESPIHRNRSGRPSEPLNV